MTGEKTTRIQTLGELRVDAGDGWQRLPRSRQTRALLLRLALDPRPQRREALCHLLFDLASDPRAALRWSLSKLRPLLGSGAESPLVADRDHVRLDPARVSIDVTEIRDMLDDEAEPLADETLLDLERRLEGDLPRDLDDVGHSDFRLWLHAEGERVRVLRCRVIDVLLARASVSAAERLRLSGQRVVLDPFDGDANAAYLRLAFAQRGRSAATSLFDELRDRHRAEDQPDDALVAAWLSVSEAPMDSTRPAASVATATSLATSAVVRPLESATSSGIADLSEVDPPALERIVPDKPSLAVLDFDVVGAHAEGDVLAGGLAADLSSRLAQLPNLFVIARASASRVSAQALPPADVGRRLGVRYLVTGSTQRAHDRVRITIGLIDADAEREIWSEHYDRPLDDLFALQDDITNAVVATIEPTIERAEMQRALIRPPESLSAWEAYHRGLWHCFRFTATDNAAAEHWFEQAIAQDRYFSRAHAGRSFAQYSRAFLNATPDVQGAIARALEAAQESVGYDGRDAMGYWSLGRALFLSRRHEEALEAIDQALVINPNYAQGHYARGFIGIHSGIDAPALGSLDVAEKLSPFDPLLFAMKCSRAVSLAIQGRYEEAVPWVLRATQEPNAHFHIYAIAASILELAGRSDEARNNARWVLNRVPDYSVEVFQRSFPHRDEATREAILAAMERAGLPRGR